MKENDSVEKDFNVMRFEIGNGSFNNFVSVDEGS